MSIPNAPSLFISLFIFLNKVTSFEHLVAIAISMNILLVVLEAIILTLILSVSSTSYFSSHLLQCTTLKLLFTLINGSNHK